MKIAILYAESRFTPWRENIDTLTAISLFRAFPKNAQGTLVHMTQPNIELAQLLSKFDLVLNLCYGFHNLSQADVACWLDDHQIKHLSSAGEQQQKAQDKFYVENVLTKNNITAPQSIQQLADINQGLYITKPRKGGCHRGIEITDAKTAFERFEINMADDKLTQPYLIGREFSVAIIPNKTSEGFEILPPLEVIPYPKRTIYLAGQSHGKTRRSYHPTLSNEERFRLEQACIGAHNALGLSFFSRVDIRMVDDIPFVLDVNTMPNMHPTKSMLPGLLKTHKIGLPEFVRRLIGMGELKYNLKGLGASSPSGVHEITYP